MDIYKSKLFKMFLTLILAVIALGPKLAQAQTSSKDFIERTEVGSSDEVNPVLAKKIIQDQVQSQIAENVIRDLLGADKFQKNKTVIQNKILKLSPRFMPFTKTGDLTKDGDIFKMQVTSRLALKDLQTLLEENGLLGLSDATPVIVPLIFVLDDVDSQTFFWWSSGSSNELQNLFLKIEDQARSSFWKSGFYILKPQQAHMQSLVPEHLRKAKLNPEEMSAVAEALKAPLVLEGPIIVRKAEQKKFNIEMNFKVFQANNGKTIADVVRKFTTEPGDPQVVVPKKIKEVLDLVMTDLATQVTEVWQRGSLGSSTFKLTFQGFFSPLQLESFKQSLQNQVTSVRNVKERVISTKAVTFEVDAVGSLQEVAQKISGISVQNRRWTASSINDLEIIFKTAGGVQ
ncbi:MAG: hypothetical protein ACOYOK_05705 [Pseudobdellovibrionaceae bacterium]